MENLDSSIFWMKGGYSTFHPEMFLFCFIKNQVLQFLIKQNKVVIKGGKAFGTESPSKIQESKEEEVNFNE